jgi:DNA-binding CsgD family transcriptional regulator
MGRERQTSTGLTPRQREVLRLVARGHTNGEIGEILGISLAGAKWHVAELMGKLNVSSREDLAESYLDEQRAGARLARWWSGALGLVSLKPWVTATAAVLAVAAAGVGTTFGLALMNGGAAEPSQTESEQAATATPSPTPTPVPLPSAPDAIWTADEALQKAEQAVRAEMASNTNATIKPGTFHLRLARWLPQSIDVEAGDPDGDRHWVSDYGVPTDMWLFAWDVPGSSISDFNGPLTFEVTALIKDGSDGRLAAFMTGYNKPGSINGLTGVGGGFRSRTQDAEREKYMTDRAPAGPAVTFGWYNDFVDGGAWLEAYPAGGGYWCVARHDANGLNPNDWCKSDDDPRNPALRARLSTTFSASGEMGEATLFVDAVPSITSLKALPGDGRELTFATYAPPSQSGITRRFAWITIGKIGSSYTLIGYDVAGNEVARFGNDAPGPPPPPPPSPTPSP